MQLLSAQKGVNVFSWVYKTTFLDRICELYAAGFQKELENIISLIFEIKSKRGCLKKVFLKKIGGK